jgi:hypothetical protein
MTADSPIVGKAKLWGELKDNACVCKTVFGGSFANVTRVKRRRGGNGGGNGGVSGGGGRTA